MTAFLQQVKSNLTVDRLAKIIEQVYSYVTTDMPVADMIYMAKAAFGINLSDITMMTLPGTATWVWNGKQNASYYVMNRPETLKYINEYFNIYNTDISDDIFDKNFVFTNEQDNDVYQIYLGNADYVIESKFSGDEIAGGELTIPMLKND
jgi:anionic cell wall polymer biosynthesis LytR-Cps2A-Psr (LCP) family protein